MRRRASRSSTSVASTDERGFWWVNPGAWPRGQHTRTGVLPIRPDVHARQHDLRVMLGERPSLLHELGDGARPVGPARQRRRAEGAVFVATVLALEEGAMSM